MSGSKVRDLNPKARGRRWGDVIGAMNAALAALKAIDTGGMGVAVDNTVSSARDAVSSCAWNVERLYNIEVQDDRMTRRARKPRRSQPRLRHRHHRQPDGPPAPPRPHSHGRGGSAVSSVKPTAVRRASARYDVNHTHVHNAPGALHTALSAAHENGRIAALIALRNEIDAANDYRCPLHASDAIRIIDAALAEIAPAKRATPRPDGRAT